LEISMNDTGLVELHGKLKGITLGPKMLACDERERIFAFALGSGIAPSATQAAELAGYCPDNQGKSRTGLRSNSLASKAHQVLHRPRVVEAIEEVCRTQFRNLVPLVISAAKQVLADPKHKDHTKMIVSLLSRLGYGETTAVAVDVNMKGEITVRDTDAAAVADWQLKSKWTKPNARSVGCWTTRNLARKS
jgi:hypothetical protein